MIKEETYAPIIEVIEDEYLIPQLNRKRRIAALLPHDYYENNKSYPVLYLHDGQNLFDDYSPFGNWGVDKSLTTLAKKGMSDIIIIAIDHGGQHRIQEYLPFPTPKYDDNQGHKYVEFMMNTLKPLVDNKYRVRKEREFTGIGGSSMGGLISLYAGLKHNDTFSRMMIFSPSLWLSQEIFVETSKFKPEEKTKIYLYCGGKESTSLHPQMLLIERLLTEPSPFSKNIATKISYNASGTHQERHWGKEFPKALQWLFF